MGPSPRVWLEEKLVIVNSHPFEGASGPFWGLVRWPDCAKQVISHSKQAGRPTPSPQAHHILGYRVASPHQAPGWSLGHWEKQTPAHKQWTKGLGEPGSLSAEEETLP